MGRRWPASPLGPSTMRRAARPRRSRSRPSARRASRAPRPSLSGSSPAAPSSAITARTASSARAARREPPDRRRAGWRTLGLLGGSPIVVASGTLGRMPAPGALLAGRYRIVSPLGVGRDGNRPSGARRAPRSRRRHQDPAARTTRETRYLPPGSSARHGPWPPPRTRASSRSSMSIRATRRPA